jgi:hypothetical protein
MTARLQALAAIEGGVVGDAVNPRGEAGIAAESRERAIGTEERVLRDFLGILLAADAEMEIASRNTRSW